MAIPKQVQERVQEVVCRFNPDEWMFPGSEHVDGTIEGAMLAGLEAYSV